MKNRTFFISHLADSYIFYKDNFEAFIKIGVFYSLLNLVRDQISKVLGEDLWILYFLILLVLFYFKMRLWITLTLTIADKYIGKTGSFWEYYQNSKHNIWQYIRVTLLLSFGLLIPIAILYAIYLTSDFPIIGVVFILIGGALVFYFMIHFILAPYLVVLDPFSKKPFEDSFNLVKESRLFVALMVLSVYTMMAAPYLIFNFLGANGIISEFINAVIQAFLLPLEVSIIFLFYYKVSELKN